MPPIYDLWAKTNDRDRSDEAPWSRHPLPLHLLDVGLVAEAWLAEDDHLLRRFCELWPEADAEAVQRALVLTAAVHDLGKVYPAFQAKSDEGWAAGYGQAWTEPEKPTGKGFDHGEATTKAFEGLVRRGVPDGLDPAWCTLAPLVRVGAGHHGTLYGPVSPDRRAAYSPLRDLLVASLDEVAHHLGPPLPLPDGPPPPFLLLVAGFVSVADWFGSNADSFPLAPKVTSRTEAEAYVRRHRDEKTAQRALQSAGLIGQFRTEPTTFGALFTPDGEPAWAPRPGFQKAACDIAFGEASGAEIAVVEAPMGLGKTEIALWLAARAIVRGTADGIYDALPTQATANAAYGRVQRVAERIADGDLALTLAHGAKRFSAEHRALRRAFASPSTSAGDVAAPAEVVAPSWLQPSKRALLAPIGVGTIDQALLAVMGVRHGFVRLFALARKVVVIDEVHAHDAYTGALLRHLLAWLGALGTKVILLSATLPASLRVSLLAAYGLADADEAPDAYPRLIHARQGSDPHAVVDPRPDAERREDDTTVSVEPVEPSDDGPEARTAAGVAWVQARLAKSGCVAWIRNTVREAQDAAHALGEAGAPVELLHARFARHDRNQIEADLLRRLGPDASDRPECLVVVATQVIEQSVDLDFDAMLSDLAPADLLLQRAGRLWRHERPAAVRQGHDEPVLGVLLPTDLERATLSFGPSAYVYDADTLARSAILVREHPAWTLPAACRTLVAALYDGAWPAGRLGADPTRLDAARAGAVKRQKQMERAARLTFLSTPTQEPHVRQARADRSDAGTHVALTTRYGAHSAAATLFRDTPAGPAPIGADQPLSVPGEGWDARLAAEEAVELATVSFPWYGEQPASVDASDALGGLRSWWTNVRPYDARHFVLLKGDGFVHGELSGRYSSRSGLWLARPGEAPPEAPPFEDI
ncbi:MAG: CRISPR-associated helicase Cas3' [Bacteroidota bacterium]